MTEAKIECRCPNPGCGGVMRVGKSTPGGVYPCVCGACEVRLSWATYLHGGRRPYLSLVEKEERK
jgi:hypothetical protein